MWYSMVVASLYSDTTVGGTGDVTLPKIKYGQHATLSPSPTHHSLTLELVNQRQPESKEKWGFELKPVKH